MKMSRCYAPVSHLSRSLQGLSKVSPWLAHGLPGNPQRTAWNLARTSHLSPFRVPTDHNDFSLNSECYSNSGVRTENRVRPGSHRFDRGRIRPDCSLPL